MYMYIGCCNIRVLVQQKSGVCLRHIGKYAWHEKEDMKLSCQGRHQLCPPSKWQLQGIAPVRFGPGALRSLSAGRDADQVQCDGADWGVSVPEVVAEGY